MKSHFDAKVTSKNQLTLPAGVSALLGVGAGDTVRFEVRENEIRVVRPLPSEGAAEWVGLFKRRGKAMSPKGRERFIRELRGDRD